MFQAVGESPAPCVPTRYPRRRWPSRRRMDPNPKHPRRLSLAAKAEGELLALTNGSLKLNIQIFSLYRPYITWVLMGCCPLKHAAKVSIYSLWIWRPRNLIPKCTPPKDWQMEPEAHDGFREEPPFPGVFFGGSMLTCWCLSFLLGGSTTCKCLGPPLAIWNRSHNPILWGLRITMAISSSWWLNQSI